MFTMLHKIWLPGDYDSGIPVPDVVPYSLAHPMLAPNDRILHHQLFDGTVSIWREKSLLLQVKALVIPCFPSECGSSILAEIQVSGS